MDIKDAIQQLVERIAIQKDAIATEDVVNNAFITPMLAALGHDAFYAGNWYNHLNR